MRLDIVIARQHVDAGRVDILSNEEIEAADLAEALRAAGLDDEFPSGSA